MTKYTETRPTIITDNDESLFSLLEIQEEEVNCIKERMIESPKYFQEAAQQLEELNCYIDDYIQSMVSLSFSSDVNNEICLVDTI